MKQINIDDYNELFIATLRMFGLTIKEGGVPSAGFIQSVFMQVLEAHQLCMENFKKHFEKYSSKYKEMGIPILD